MDVGVVDGERAVQPIDFGSIIANRYTILRPDKVGRPHAYICREVDAEPLRAVWALRPAYDGDPTGQAFLSEMGQVQKLEHPQLRKLLDFGRDPSGVLYAVFEPLEIRNLNDVLEKEWPLSDERVVWLVCQLLATLEVAHAAGLSHGDLRPENVLVRAAGATTQNEELLLCGLGLANSSRYGFPNRNSLPQLKLADWMVGTPGYAAPEQLRGDRHDARSDVYGAGLLMFQLLTRSLPFSAANDYDTAFMQCFTPPPPPSSFGRVSPALEAICLKALTKTPDMRYQSANEMRAALLAAQATRNSRNSARVSVRPSRPSQPRISSVPAEVVATRLSEPGVVLATRVDSVTTAPIETPIPAEPERKRSTALLLMCCGAAVMAAMVLPDLRLGEETEALGDNDEPAEQAPPAAPKPQPAAAKPDVPAPQPKAAAVPAPVVLEPVPTESAAAQLPAAKPAPAPEPSPRPTARTTARAARVRLRNVEKSVVAAEVSHDGTAPVEHGSLPMASVTGLQQAAIESTPAAESVATADVEPARIELPALEQPEPVAEAPQPELAAPKPIILSTISPPAPASEPAPSKAPTTTGELSVVISDGASTQGAVSKASLRGALNQAAITRCYRDAVHGGAAPARPVSARLEIGTHLSGRITSAKLSGDGLPNGLVRCVEAAARLGRVREADTGEVRATFELIFRR